MLVDDGFIVRKYFLHITKETQLKRFEERKDNPIKRWKLTDEDWRNREKWEDYEEATEDMLRKTHQKQRALERRFIRVQTPRPRCGDRRFRRRCQRILTQKEQKIRLHDQYSTDWALDAWLNQDSNRELNADYSDWKLDPVHDALAALPEKAIRPITVAGTKGKGSTVAFLERIIAAHGRKWLPSPVRTC